MTTQQRTNRVAMTGCDYFNGHEIARHLLSVHRRDNEQCRLVCTGAHKNRMRDLERQGADVVQVKPDDVKEYEAVFRDCDWVILVSIPEHDRVESSRRIMEAIKRANVKRVILISSTGAESNEKLKHLHEYAEIEKEFKNQGYNWNCVLRNEFSQNWFHAWSQPVEDKGQFPLSTGRDKKFAPVRLEDVCCALKDIIRGEESTNNKHNKQIYTLTGPEAVNGPKIVDELNRVVQGRVNYADVDRQQMEKVLRSLREREQQQRGGRDDDDDNRDYFEDQPTDTQIHTILDYFDYVKSGKADRTTEDLRKLTGRDGQRVEAFFKEHASEFRPGHRQE